MAQKISLVEQGDGFSIWDCPATVKSAFADNAGPSNLFRPLAVLLPPPTQRDPQQPHDPILFQTSWQLPTHTLRVWSTLPYMATSGLMELLLQICERPTDVLSDPLVDHLSLRIALPISHSDIREYLSYLTLFINLDQGTWLTKAKSLGANPAKLILASSTMQSQPATVPDLPIRLLMLI